jgi:hypothetical protein
MTAPSLTRLLETWQSWSYRDVLVRLIGEADAAGEADRSDLLRRGLALEQDVAPLDALAANHELTRLLRGWQWHAIRAAREAGASWARIGTALGTTAEQARADYLDPIELAERYGRGLTDTAPYRAVLDDPLPRSSVVDQRPVSERSLVLGGSSEVDRRFLAGGGPAHRSESAASQPPAVRGRGRR